MFRELVLYSSIILICLGFSALPTPAQVPGVLIWEYNTSQGVYTSIGVPDVDGDGYPDVVAAIYYINPGADLYCVSGAAGDSIWESSDCLGTWGNKALASIRDVDGDGVDDVILGTPGGIYPGRSVIVKSGATGGTIWFNDAPSGWVYSVSTVPDVNGDTVPDVIAGAGGSPAAAFCFDGVSGNMLWTLELNYSGACWNVAPIGDVNASGVADVIVGTEGSIPFDVPALYCVEGSNGDTIWSYIVDDNLMDVCSFNDVDDDGIEEVIAGGWTDSVYCLAGVDGKLIWGASIGDYVQEITPIEDVNGDSLDDVLVGSWLSSMNCLDGASGDLLWSAPVGGDCWSVAAVPDINGDGIMDAVAGAVNGRRVLCVSGVDGSPVWDYYSGERIYDVSSIDDVNGDGLADVLVGLQDQGNAVNHLLCFDGDANLGVEEVANCKLQTANCKLSQNHPNPFTAVTSVQFSVPSGFGNQHVSLRIYDVSGRLIRTLFDKVLATDHHRQGGIPPGRDCPLTTAVSWDGKDSSGRPVASGIYLYRLSVGMQSGRAGRFESTGKMVVLR